MTAPQPVIIDDDLDDEPAREAQASARRSRKGRSGPKVAVGVLVVAAALGAGGYFGYQWTQSQFYIGAKGDELVVFQGVDAEVGPVSFKKVAYTDHVRVSSLPAVQQDQVRSGIPVDDLQAGISKIKSFGDSAAPKADAESTPTPTRSSK